MFSGGDEYQIIDNQLAQMVIELPDSPLGEIIGYVLSSPGKRVRPLILMLSAEAFGGTAEEAANAALAVELVHAASLVHDDILDQGIERRGTQSALERFGPEAALLAGDWLISRSIELISHYRQPVIAAFSAACMDMAEGELMDLSAASSADDYYNCISKKTASLFSASAKIGAMLSGADNQDVSCLESYGKHLGLGYQVLDDLEEFLGLDQGKSSLKTSVTLPRIYNSLHEKDAAAQMCIKIIEEHICSAKDALRHSSGEALMLRRLESIVDEMTHWGLKRCRSPRSLC
ncbi:MAG TPA: polyprenyl synthetase family protein [Methanothrix sp.]|jgi:octaprenyl-diphosphate synthase|nr:polyprenyl synthetase family protein [Methanothrix sp.]